jgi:hypothetical protein
LAPRFTVASRGIAFDRAPSSGLGSYRRRIHHRIHGETDGPLVLTRGARVIMLIAFTN